MLVGVRFYVSATGCDAPSGCNPMSSGFFHTRTFGLLPHQNIERSRHEDHEQSHRLARDAPPVGKDE
jgi:hypothetical protein